METTIVYLDAEEHNADWLKTGRLPWWTRERMERFCAGPYRRYHDRVRAGHVAYYAARPAERSATHAFVAASLEHALPAARISLAADVPQGAWHIHHLSGGSSQVLGVALLGTAARQDETLAWLGLGDLGGNVATRFETALDPSVLNERPRVTTVDWLVESDEVVAAVEAKFMEEGVGECSCRDKAMRGCSDRVLERPYWDVARTELGLEGPTPGARCRLGLSYQAVRNVAAARALAGGRRAAFVLAYDARNPYFARTGAWPGWPALLARALERSSVEFRALSWQELVARRAVPQDVAAWAREKHGILPP